ncbi:hypothetical protein FVQ98_11110 [Ottowia sp. GY511]|uniref:hypothetical protein n=1 Tax=Ottowia sp. GY511 TaxID=2603274 RepID=UPI0011D9F011|nr:hypothetical protein [Ottowia sp. GY511]TXK27856.1 hypothetical protein FVQ98_11110 [Ottowia sp. GY511]
MPNQVVGGARGFLTRLGLAAIVAGAGLAGCAPMGTGMAAPSTARVDRLAALFVQAVPVGWMVDRVAARDTQWPFQKYPGRYTPTQLACTRGELTADKVSATQHADARAFARRYPDRVEESIQVLESGAAEAMGLLMRAGMGEAISGRKVDAGSVMRSLSAGQLRAFNELGEGTQHTELRQAMRIDELASGGSRAQTHQRGVRLGQSLLVGPMLSAMERCQVSPGTLFDKAGTLT